MSCGVHDAPLERENLYEEGEEFEACTYCVADLTGQTDWQVHKEEVYSRYQIQEK